MKYFPLFFIFFFAFVVSAQTNQDSPCPTISIRGEGVFNPNEPVTFTAFVSKEIEKYNVKYQWAVSSGEILEGQGTTQIKVPWRSLCETNLTATLEILGLPETCPSIASETGSISDCFSRPVLVEEYGKILYAKEKTKLDIVAAKLLEDKYSTKYARICFIIYLTGKQKSGEIKSRQANIEKYLSEVHKIPKDRISFIFSENNQFGRNWTKVFIVPPEAENPQP